jgi:hypothetical protein
MVGGGLGFRCKEGANPGEDRLADVRPFTVRRFPPHIRETLHCR